MKKINDWVLSIGFKNNYSFFAACFRIFICLFLFKNILITWQHRIILFKSQSLLPPSSSNILDFISINDSLIRNHFEVFAIAFIICILLHLRGIGKYFIAALVFFFYEIMQRLCPIILNGGDNILKFLILYMVFLNSYDYFSISRYRPLNTKIKYFSVFFSNVSGFSICIHICFVYFVSA